MSFQGCVTLVPVSDSTSACASKDCVGALAEMVVQAFPTNTTLLFETREILHKFNYGPVPRNWRDGFLFSSSDTNVAYELCERLKDVRELMQGEDAAIVLGAVLEMIVFHAVARHYRAERCELRRGFAVYVDGVPTSATDKSLDVGGWDNERNKGELYEVKSLGSRYGLLSESVIAKLDYLQRLAARLDVKEGERIVALASWQHTGKMKDDFDECRWPLLSLYGLADLPQLRSGVIAFGDS